MDSKTSDASFASQRADRYTAQLHVRIKQLNRKVDDYRELFRTESQTRHRLLELKQENKELRGNVSGLEKDCQRKDELLSEVTTANLKLREEMLRYKKLYQDSLLAGAEKELAEAAMAES